MNESLGYSAYRLRAVGTLLLPPIMALAALVCPVASAAPPLPVVVTFSILGDMVRTVGGERIAVTVLVGPGADAHAYQPTPAAARAVADAAAIFLNGAGFEGWMERLVRTSGYRGRVVVATEGLALDPDAPADAGRRGRDPHAWHDPELALGYVRNIRDGLAAIDPEGSASFAASAERYAGEIAALRAELRAAMSAVEPQRRRIVTPHRAFDYLARAIGFTAIAPSGVVPGAQASAGEIARLVRQAQAARISAVFVESVADERLARRIAQEAGVTLGGALYADALSGPAGPASTYLSMMRHNVRTLVEGMQRR